VASAETAQSGYALRGVCLLGVLLTARAAVLIGRPGPRSLWSLVAYVWQDVLVALLFVALDARLKRPRVGWSLYAALVIYIAVNVPVTRVLSSPLTWTMIRAARGPLADAILHYVTFTNVIGLALPLVAAVWLPRLLMRAAMRMDPSVAGAAVLLVALGPFATARLETGGLHRNAIGALVETSVTRVAAKDAFDDWRTTPATEEHGKTGATEEHDKTGATEEHGITRKGVPDSESRTSDPGSRLDLRPLRGSMRGRNVVLVALESTGARHLGLYGSVPDPAPNLTALASQSIVFERAYSVYPESIKGLFATLCSRYPAFDTAPEIYADVPCASLAAAVKSAGYRTALFHSGRFLYLGMASVIDRRGFDAMEDAGAIGGRVDSSFGVDDASTVSRVLQWIDTVDPRTPFFVTYLPTSGHNPYMTTTPGPFRTDQDFWRYMNALHESDAAFGALVEGLRQRRLLDNTLFVVFGDHGEAFGEHPGNFAHTLFIHEENVRIPLVIAAPGAIEKSLRVPRVASVIDIAPTILDLLGLPSQPLHQGASLLPPESRMALFYTDYSIGWLGLADGCWKYLYEIDSRRSRLFDVCADPGEMSDRALEHSERIAAYRDRVIAWAGAQRDLVQRRATSDIKHSRGESYQRYDVEDSKRRSTRR
jgi:phosphoglycerol transferase MdoB-like AlkP superfamily enzyme